VIGTIVGQADKIPAAQRVGAAAEEVPRAKL
jgi:hypothetical protein